MARVMPRAEVPPQPVPPGGPRPGPSPPSPDPKPPTPAPDPSPVPPDPHPPSIWADAATRSPTRSTRRGLPVPRICPRSPRPSPWPRPASRARRQQFELATRRRAAHREDLDGSHRRARGRQNFSWDATGVLLVRQASQRKGAPRCTRASHHPPLSAGAGVGW